MITVADYHPQELDKKWQAHWASTQAFEVTEDPSKPKFYCPRDVRLPVRARARRARPQLHHRRRRRAAEAAAGVQRAPSLRMGRVRAARRERGDQERHPSRDLHARQHRPHEGAVAAPGDQLRLGTRARHLPARLLPLEPVAVHAHVRARPGLPPPLDGELVPGRQHRAGQRAGDRRRVLALRHRGRSERPGAVVLQDHALRRRSAARPPKAWPSGRRKS